jgi:hypothetical protein
LRISTTVRKVLGGTRLRRPNLKGRKPMRSIASIVLPIIIAAGTSGLMFTATLI